LKRARVYKMLRLELYEQALGVHFPRHVVEKIMEEFMRGLAFQIDELTVMYLCNVFFTYWRANGDVAMVLQRFRCIITADRMTVDIFHSQHRILISRGRIDIAGKRHYGLSLQYIPSKDIISILETFGIERKYAATLVNLGSII